MPEKPPYRLAEGVQLERAGVLLPWGATPEQLKGLGAPRVDIDDFEEVLPQRSGRRLRLAWEDEIFFGGLRGVVAAQFWSFENEAQAEEQTGLQQAAFGIDRLPGAPHGAWEKFHQLMQKRFGKPDGTPGHGPLPWPKATWTLPGLELSAEVGEQMGELLQLILRRRV